MSTKVIKRTPDLGIGIKLQPLGVGASAEQSVPAAPAQSCAVASVGWAWDYRTFYPHFVSDPSSDFPMGGPFINVDENNGGRAIRIGVPPPAWTPDLWWGEHDAYVFYGVPEGAAISGVRWTWEVSGVEAAMAALDAGGGQWSGIMVDSVGPLLRVRIGDLDPAGVMWSVQVNAVAHCGSEEVGTLWLITGYSGGYGGY